MGDTPERLRAAALETLRLDGIAGLSARTVAARAEANQALIFYHFGTLAGLVDAAVRASADERLAFYRDQFAGVTSLADLLRVGRDLHDQELSRGNVAVMAQLLAGAQREPVLAAAAEYAMRTWTTEIEGVVRRVLRDSPVAEVVEPVGLARAVSAAFVGLELYDGVDRAGATSALDALERLSVLVEVVDELGPVARRALRSRVRRRAASR